MERNPNVEMEGIADDLGYPQRDSNFRRTKTSTDYRRLRRILLFWAAGILLSVVLVVLLFKGNDEMVMLELNGIKESMGQLEKRLAELERVNRRVDRLEGQIKGLRNSLANLKKLAARATKVPPVAKAKSSPSTKKRFHKVRPGETLYGIAIKYGITVDQLRKYNSMGKKKNIRPGQKLWITPR
jgi:LysM repeat protein